MTYTLTSIGYPHWLMVAGGFLVVLGFVGLVMRRERVEAEPDTMVEERAIFKFDGEFPEAKTPVPR